VAGYRVVAHFVNNTWLFSSFVKPSTQSRSYLCPEGYIKSRSLCLSGGASDKSGNFRQCCAVLFVPRTLDPLLLLGFHSNRTFGLRNVKAHLRETRVFF